MIEKEKRGRGRPRNGFDKKQYDRERMKRLRAGSKVNPVSSKAQEDKADD